MPSIGRYVAKLSGYAPALPTPFDDNGDVDGEAFERLCDLQITLGATALVVCGTTGEATTLTPKEHGELIRIAVGVLQQTHTGRSLRPFPGGCRLDRIAGHSLRRSVANRMRPCRCHDRAACRAAADYRPQGLKRRRDAAVALAGLGGAGFPATVG